MTSTTATFISEIFDSILTEQKRVRYHNTKVNREPVAGYTDRLLAAEALVLVYPVWNEGFPAILKGFFDRVFIPGVSFNVAADSALVPNGEAAKAGCRMHLWRQSRDQFSARRSAQAGGEAHVCSMPSRAVRFDYLAFYGTDHSDVEQRAAFLTKVRRTFESVSCLRLN